MKKLSLIAVALFLGALVSANAGVFTNSLGQVVTVTTMSDVADAGTVVADQSTYATPVSRLGCIVAECTVPSGTTSLEFGYTVPKGAILLESGTIECSTTVATATNVSLAVGGVTVLAAGGALSSGVTACTAANLPAITTSTGKLTLTVAGDAATAGKFMVYLPYILGNASR